MNLVQNLKILIVEDDATSYLLLVEELGESNEFLHAFEGLEAVEMARKNPDLDLILMDIKLPLMNGFDATKKIREFNQKVVIIAETAYSFPEDEVKSLEAGCDDYIAKPILKEQLLTLIEKNLKLKKLLI